MNDNLVKEENSLLKAFTDAQVHLLSFDDDNGYDLGSNELPFDEN